MSARPGWCDHYLKTHGGEMASRNSTEISFPATCPMAVRPGACAADSSTTSSAMLATLVAVKPTRF